MAQLSADLELTIDSALSAINDLASALNDSVDSFSSALTDAIDSALQPQALEVDADVTPAEEAIDALPTSITEEVDADTTSAEADIDSLDGQVITADLELNTDDAESALSDLSGGVENFGGAADGASSSAGGLDASMGLLAGGGLKGLSAAFGPVGIAAAGVGVALYGLANAGIEDISMAERLKAVMGDLRFELQQIPVGDTTWGIQKLAESFGSSKDELMDVNATLFQFATLMGGRTGPEAVTFAANIDYLAARAVALKPSLGSVADVAEQMQLKIGRGGRFMTKLGLDLTATEIKAEATAIKLEKFGLTAEAAAARTGDLTTMTEEQQAAISAAGADLSDFDKAEAGVAISMRKHGQEQDALTAGAKNAANVQKGFKVVLGEMIEEMGKPLVAPMFEIMKSAMPIVKALAHAFADFAKAVLPTIMESFRSLQPVIDLVVDALKELLPPFIAISSWVYKTFNVFNLLRKVFGDDVFQKFTDWIRQAVVDVKAFIKPVTDAVKAFDWDGALNHLQTVVSTVFTFIGNTISNVWNGIIKPALEAMGWLIENILIPVLKTLWDVQVAVWGAISDVISFAWNNVIKPTYDLMTTVVNNVLIPGFNLLSSVVGAVWNAISTAISFAWNSIISPAFEGIKSGFQTVIDFFNGAKNTIGGVFSAIGNTIKGAFNTAFGAVKSLWNDTVGGFGFTVPSWVPLGIGGKSFHIPRMHEGGMVPGVAGIDVPAILQAGELVISRPQLKALMSNQPLPQAQAPQSSSPVIGSMTVIGQDPVSTAAAVGRELAFQRRFQGGT